VDRVPRKLTVKVAADQFEELCRPSQPLAAVAELAWNGLDAEATEIDVVVTRTELDAVQSVSVAADALPLRLAKSRRFPLRLGPNS
jgi:hypothetical protein